LYQTLVSHAGIDASSRQEAPDKIRRKKSTSTDIKELPHIRPPISDFTSSEAPWHQDPPFSDAQKDSTAAAAAAASS
jgi:hypothetical protein